MCITKQLSILLSRVSDMMWLISLCDCPKGHHQLTCERDTTELRLIDTISCLCSRSCDGCFRALGCRSRDPLQKMFGAEVEAGSATFCSRCRSDCVRE